jgi:uncharacterized protein (UPF0548 family)
VITFGRPDPARLDALLEQEEEQALTFREVGASVGVMPHGFRHDRYDQPLGSGDAVYARARAGLAAWEAHRGAGVALHPAEPRLRAGTTLLVSVPVGPLHAVGGCRIVHVVDEPARYGFVYATLPSHPLVGEESFTVVRRGGDVTFEVMSISRWRDPLARAGAPVARVLQVATTRRYLRALARYVDGAVDRADGRTGS